MIYKSIKKIIATLTCVVNKLYYTTVIFFKLSNKLCQANISYFFRFLYFSMDSCDYLKNTPLHVAAAKAKLKDVQYLLEEKKVSPFVRNR